MLLRPGSGIRALGLGFSGARPLGLGVCDVGAVACDHGHSIAGRFTKLSKIGFSLECFTADFWRVCSTAVGIWLLVERLAACHLF